jgi:hypothetical protein
LLTIYKHLDESSPFRACAGKDRSPMPRSPGHLVMVYLLKKADP